MRKTAESLRQWADTGYSRLHAAESREAADTIDRLLATIRSLQQSVTPEMEERFAKALQVNDNLAERIHILTTGLPNEFRAEIGYFRAALYANVAPITEKDVKHCQEVIARVEARRTLSQHTAEGEEAL